MNKFPAGWAFLRQTGLVTREHRMERFGSVDQILDFAINREEEAHEFYEMLARRVENPAMQQIFKQFALEELGHKAKLESVKAGTPRLSLKEVQDLGIADYVVGGKVRPDMSYADALILAMQREKASYRLYLDLAGVAEAAELTDMFLSLAQQEARHKLTFEIEYDDVVLKED